MSLIGTPHDLKPPAARELERAARASGLSLEQWELIAQEATIARGFIQAFLEHREQAYLGWVDWAWLEALRDAREVRKAPAMAARHVGRA